MAQILDEFYYWDGKSAVGPQTSQEMLKLYAQAIIGVTTPIMRKGERGWQTLGAHPAFIAYEPLAPNKTAAPQQLAATSKAVKLKLDRDSLVFTVLRIVAVVMLVWAQAKHSSNYYTALRFIVCVTAGYGAYYANKMQQQVWLWVMLGVAALFNPVLPVYLTKTQWGTIDHLTAVCLVVSFFLLRQPALNKQSKEATHGRAV